MTKRKQNPKKGGRPRNPGNPNDIRLVQRARETLGWTQDQMGAALHLTQGAVSHVEKGIRPLSRLARAELKRLLNMQEAVGLVAAIEAGGVGVEELRCHWQDAAPSDYLLHLDTCAKCLAHSVRLRTPRR